MAEKNNKKAYYVTTAIDYVNAEPHIGHAYQKIIADALARWNKLQGKDVFFLTGTDEHGQKIALSAKENKKTEKQFVDEMAKKFIGAWKNLNIDYNRFIRTTDKDHEKFVQEFVSKIKKDIYKGMYEGYYCVGCEEYKTEKELIDGKCQYHPNKKIEILKEETYFFKLSKYKKKLLELYKKHPEFILPEERRNEIINRVKEGLKDLSITRTNFNWGIEFPLDKKHVIYVWFDALLNYLSGAGKNQEYWPADLHLLGKDNGWFHSVIWPAMLLSAGETLPKTVFIHGFLTFNNQKISKSLGNAISPKFLAEKYTSDVVRYYVTRNFVFGQDGDFSESKLIERNNTELANKLGNLISRVSTLAEKYGIEETENNLSKKLRLEEIETHIKKYELDKALNLIFEFIDNCNEYVQEKKPWETQDKEVLYELADSIKLIAILLWSFMPETCEKIAGTFGFKIKSLEDLHKPLKNVKIKKSDILFKKIE
jgi:methionyl-tRNA synthetase